MDIIKACKELSPLELAPLILGSYLVHRTGSSEVLKIKIVEVEAYGGAEDAASHAHAGPTPRAKVMYEEGGIAYVYLSYGVHYCFNIVCRPKGSAGAVLVRAGEPVHGVEVMKKLRGRENITDIASGPGKFCQAMKIDLRFNGINLFGPKLFLEPRRSNPKIASGKRIGISKAKDYPWRFWIKDHTCVSRT